MLCCTTGPRQAHTLWEHGKDPIDKWQILLYAYDSVVVIVDDNDVIADKGFSVQDRLFNQ